MIFKKAAINPIGRVSILLFAFLCFGTTRAYSQWAQQLTCSNAEGHCFYIAIPGVVEGENNGKTGWEIDGMTGSQMILMRFGDEFDILYGPPNALTSVRRDDNARVAGFTTRSGNTMVHTFYPETVSGIILTEQYLFSTDVRGRKHLLYTRQRDNPALGHSVSSVFHLECV